MFTNGESKGKHKARAIIEAKPPSNKIELQRFMGQINLRRIISNLVGKVMEFASLIQLKRNEFIWKEEFQKTFDGKKTYPTKPPVLVPPCPGQLLKLYIATVEESNGSLLAKDNKKGKEQAMYYRFLNKSEIKILLWRSCV